MKNVAVKFYEGKKATLKDTYGVRVIDGKEFVEVCYAIEYKVRLDVADFILNYYDNTLAYGEIEPSEDDLNYGFILIIEAIIDNRCEKMHWVSYRDVVCDYFERFL